MRYVVGYTPSDRGADAVALASALARAQGAQLDLVYVVDRGTPYVARTRGKRCQRRASRRCSRTRNAEGLSLIPEDVEAKFHVRHARRHTPPASSMRPWTTRPD